MKRNLIVAVASLLLAVPVSANFEYSPARLDLRVGESAKVSVGITSLGTTIGGMSFYSCNPSVATASGKLTVEPGANSGSGTIRVKAVGPGKTRICSREWSGSIPVTVTCGPVPAAEAANARVTTRAGTPVTLSVIFPLLENTTYTWYRGRAGDTAAPLAGADADLDFTPAAGGTHQVWVEVATPCSTSSVEFVVDATAGRRRSVR